MTIRPIESRSRFAPALAGAVLILIIVWGAPDRVSAHPDGPGGDDVSAPSSFTLFRPAPRGAMRELHTDRRVESPYTVDAGHLQLEIEALAYHRDRLPGTKLETWGMAITHVKVGLLQYADLQLLLESRIRDRVEVALPTGPQVFGGTRFGDAVARLKVNVWGNDAGRTALGVTPFASLRSDSRADFGVIVPFAAALPHGLGLGTVARVEWQYARDYQTRWIGSASVSHAIAGAVSGWVELWGDRSFVRGERDAATLDAGVAYDLGEDLRFDTGVSLPLNDAAEDLALFLGVSLRR